jgi:2-hydroxy-6-oxonona-2,4-dienedioate hydrolase
MVVSDLTEQSTSRFVQTSRWRIHYNEAGSGHPIIMLHGTGPGATGWANFSQNLVALSDKYRVIAIDFPGWGLSDPCEPKDRDNALAVKLLMDELGIEKAALVGNSMGGIASVTFSVLYTERLSHLITMGAAAMGTNIFAPGGGFSEGMKVLRECYAEPTPQNFERLVRVMVYDSTFATPELMKMRSEAALANKVHLENWLKPANVPGNGMYGPADTMTRLLDMQVPALLVHGRDDRVVPFENSMRLLSLIPNSNLVLFNHCGHWAQIEHAETFNWMVDNFIQHN